MTRGSAWWKGWSYCQVAAPGPNSPPSGATGITCSCVIERLGPQRALDPVLSVEKGAAKRPRQVLSPQSHVGRVHDVLGDDCARVHPLRDRDGDLGVVRVPDGQKTVEERLDECLQQILLVDMMERPGNRSLHLQRWRAPVDNRLPGLLLRRHVGQGCTRSGCSPRARFGT